MDPLVHQVAERVIDHPLSLNAVLAGEGGAFDCQAEMTFPGRIVAAVAAMLLAVVGSSTRAGESAELRRRSISAATGPVEPRSSHSIARLSCKVRHADHHHQRRAGRRDRGPACGRERRQHALPAQGTGAPRRDALCRRVRPRNHEGLLGPGRGRPPSGRDGGDRQSSGPRQREARVGPGAVDRCDPSGGARGRMFRGRSVERRRRERRDLARGVCGGLCPVVRSRGPDLRSSHRRHPRESLAELRRRWAAMPLGDSLTLEWTLRE